MSVVEKSTTFKIEWQVTSCNSKSHEIELEEGLKVCFGVKTVVFQHVVYLVSKSNQPSIFEIGEVLFCTCTLPDQRKRMNCVSTEGPNSVFSAEISEWKTPLTFTCWISLKVAESLGNYSYQLRDALLTEQLWMSAKNTCLTDVEFHVGQASKSKTFAAHRSVLTARSPVLATLLEKVEKSSSVTLEDVQPAIFKHFLRFLYTGQLRASAVSNLSELQALSDRYQIGTLQKLCRHPIQEMNASELTSLILSINYNSVPSKLDTASLFNKPFNRLTHMSPLLVGTELHSTANTSLLPASTAISGQTYSTSGHDRANIFFTGNALTPSASSNSDFTFPKLNQATGPISFNFGNRTPSSANGASPVIGLQQPNNKFIGQAQGASSSSISSSVGKFPAIASTPTTTTTTTVQTNISTVASSVPGGSRQTTSVANNAIPFFSIKPSSVKQTVDAESLTLKAVVVSAAVSRLRMIFDELLGSVETTIASDETESTAAPPPSPESNSQHKQLFLLSPPKLKLSPSQPSSPEICFSFPSVTKEGRFGKAPLKSPPRSSKNPWQPNNIFGADLLKPVNCTEDPLNQMNEVDNIMKNKDFSSAVSPRNREPINNLPPKNSGVENFERLSPEERAENYHKPLTRASFHMSSGIQHMFGFEKGLQKEVWKNPKPEKNSGTTSL